VLGFSVYFVESVLFLLISFALCVSLSVIRFSSFYRQMVPTDSRTCDCWALGVLAHIMLTGEVCFVVFLFCISLCLCFVSAVLCRSRFIIPTACCCALRSPSSKAWISRTFPFLIWPKALSRASSRRSTPDSPLLQCENTNNDTLCFVVFVFTHIWFLQLSRCFKHLGFSRVCDLLLLFVRKIKLCVNHIDRV
jgi:hypothetical protein